MSTLNTAIQEMIDRLTAGLKAGNLTPEDQLLISKALSALQDNGQWEQALIAVAEYHLNEGVGAMTSATAGLNTAQVGLSEQAAALLEEARGINENYIIPAANSELIAGRKHFLPLDRVVKIPANTQSGDVFHIRVCRVRTSVATDIKFPPIHKGEDKVLHRFMATGNKVFIPAGLFANFYGNKVAGGRNVNVLCDMAITNVDGVLVARHMSDESEHSADVDAVVAARTLPSQVVTASEVVTPPDGATMAIVNMVGGGASRCFPASTSLPVSMVAPAASAIGVRIPLASMEGVSVTVGQGGSGSLSPSAAGRGGGRSCFCDAWVGGGTVDTIRAPVPGVGIPYPYELAHGPDVACMWASYEAKMVAYIPIYDAVCGGCSTAPYGRVGQNWRVKDMPALLGECHCVGEVYGCPVGYPAPVNIAALRAACVSEGSMFAPGVSQQNSMCVNATSLTVRGVVPCSVSGAPTVYPISNGCCVASTSYSPSCSSHATWGSLFGPAAAVCSAASLSNVAGQCVPVARGAPGVTTTPCCHRCDGAIEWPGTDGVVEIIWL